ncbi:MAG: cytochrome b/b6 domain-containing protein [Nitrospirae bacterium]|nr:cytochrome b/b6 domain-containing protein [Nitrospirota bacterium]
MRPELLIDQYPLTEDEKNELKSKKIKKYKFSIIWAHWLNAFAWLVLTVTGVAIINNDKYNLVPLGFTQWMSSLFSSREYLLKFHVWLGIFWILDLSLYVIFGAKRYSPDIKSVFTIDTDDRAWLVSFTRKVMGLNYTFPPQGFLNAGQKLVAMAVFTMTPVIMITGLIMAFQLLPPFFIRASILIHLLAVGAVACALPIHIFMGGCKAHEHESLKSMITGYMSEYFAYKHNYKFWRDVKKAALANKRENP